MEAKKMEIKQMNSVEYDRYENITTSIDLADLTQMNEFIKKQLPEIIRHYSVGRMFCDPGNQTLFISWYHSPKDENFKITY